ncbi:alpha/beta fold hydrolase [Halomonas sp. V046]|uniref:alpha/beta fold hydrolase n=1 Tax=Halomonas sp. V046 TaxID=3459611 RepID=UPI0040440675
MTALVLLSGWGVDARVWLPLTPYWSPATHTSRPDWPGVGQRRKRPMADAEALPAMAAAMADDLPSDAVWVGWSLGALYAAALLEYLPAPRGLIMLGMGPRFCHPEGVDHHALERFRQAFQRAPDATRDHFLRWQLRGEPSPRESLRELRGWLGDEPPADTDTLARGLDALATLDVERTLSAARCPVVHLCGDSDPLLAPEVRRAAHERIQDAGHSPMTSQPSRLAAAIERHAKAMQASPTQRSCEASP